MLISGVALKYVHIFWYVITFFLIACSVNSSTEVTFRIALALALKEGGF
jgi:hypothetical protein